jgi:KDO2-lipid IV(A) lauroyltransferase
MHPKVKRLYGHAAASALKALEGRLSQMGVEEAVQTGQRFGRALHRLASRRRNRAEANLAMAFPHWPASRVRECARASFEHFGGMAADFLAGSRRTPEQVRALTVASGADRLREALSRGKGVLVVTGHYGHWERSAQYLAATGIPISVVARDADDSGVNAIVNQARRRPGNDVISRGSSASQILRRLRAGEIVAILADQNAEDAYVPFFGRLAGVNCGVGVLAARTGATVLPGWSRHMGGGIVQVGFDEPLVADPDPGPPGSGMMSAYHRWLEGVVSEAPEQWLWFHDRWRYAREAGLR